MNYEETYRRSIDEPEAFWGEEAKRIHWHKPPQQVLDYSNPPFRRWFVGGETNLCYNAVDRHRQRAPTSSRWLRFPPKPTAPARSPIASCIAK